MRTGELWWNRLVNSVRFLDDVRDELIQGKSVIMTFSGNIPWSEDMADILEQKLSVLTDSRSIKFDDVPENVTEPGKYLFEKYFDESERRKYWPDKSYEQFMAENDNTTLNHRILCIRGINSTNAAVWIKSVSKYLEHCNSEERCIFILIVQQADTNESKNMTSIRYSEYVTDYDCLMLCLTLLSTEKCSSLQKQYVSEIAGNIAQNNAETAGLLAHGGISLAEDPYGVSSEIFRDYDIKITNLSEVVEAAVWEAQIKIVFPKLEEYRRNFVQKYNTEIQNNIQMINSDGDNITKASEAEIGQLFYLFGRKRILEKNEFDMLGKMRDARNKLAHRETIDYRKLKELKIF